MKASGHPVRGEVMIMIVKSPMFGVGSYRNYQRDEELFGEDLLIQLLLSTAEVDEFIADQSSLYLAQQHLGRRPLPGGLPGRRVIPPRRHLRNK